MVGGSGQLPSQLKPADDTAAPHRPSPCARVVVAVPRTRALPSACAYGNRWVWRGSWHRRHSQSMYNPRAAWRARGVMMRTLSASAVGWEGAEFLELAEASA